MPNARTMGSYSFAIVPILLAGTIACSDMTIDAGTLIGPQRHTTLQTIRGPGSASCAASPTVVVSAELALLAAVAASSPGDVIAIDGTIVLTHEIWVRTGGVTFTCSRPGDGLAVGAFSSIGFYPFVIYAPDVTVQGLSIDARNAGGAIYAEAMPGGNDGRRVRVTGNDIQCGQDLCMFVVGPGARITNNTLTSASNSPVSGIHLQNLPDSALVEGNQLIALAPQGNIRFGAIRVVGGRDVVVRDNVITGPWSNGLALTILQGGFFERNSVSGAWLHGMHVAYGPSTHAVTVRGALFRDNTANAGGPALFVDGACGNVFIANRLSTIGTGPAATFAQNTGANSLFGEHRGGVVDNGNYDCDGDGSIDPNMVSGMKRRGTTSPGEVIGSVMRNLRGIVIE